MGRPGRLAHFQIIFGAAAASAFSSALGFLSENENHQLSMKYQGCSTKTQRFSMKTNESVPLASSAVPPVVAAPEAAFPSPAGSESIERPDGWLVFDSVYGAIPHEVATRWKQSELDSQRRREKHKPAHEASSSRVLPPVRSPVSR